MDTTNAFITVAEHKEFCRHIEAEHESLAAEDRRQNERINVLEKDVRQISSLTTSVEKLAINMECMLKEQTAQGKRLKTLEDRDGEKWRQVIGYIATAIIGIVLGFIFKHLGM